MFKRVPCHLVSPKIDVCGNGLFCYIGILDVVTSLTIVADCYFAQALHTLIQVIQSQNQSSL